VASIDTATAFTLTGASWTANQFAAATSPYLARIKVGNQSGLCFLITANTASQLTVNNGGTTLSSVLNVGDSVEVTPANTLSSLFGQTAPGFLTGASANAADNIFLWNGNTWTVYYNDGSNWWNTSSLKPQNSAIIYPDEGLFITRRSTSPLTLTFLGAVPSTTEQSLLNGAGSSFIANRFPVSTTLSAFGLQNSPNWTAGSSANTADNVYMWTGTTWSVYYFDGTNWWNTSSLKNQNSTPIPPATPLFVKRANQNPTELVQQLPYNL
jgi:uncharacterized protein (TIGR02597 family)